MYEKIINATFILIMIVLNFLCIYTAFAQLFYNWRYKIFTDEKFVIVSKTDHKLWEISQEIGKIVHLTMIILHILLIFTEFSLLYTLCKLLKKNLNFYYKKNRRNLIILALASSLYFSVSILYFLENDTNIGRVVNRDQIRYLGNYPLDYTVLELLIYYTYLQYINYFENHNFKSLVRSASYYKHSLSNSNLFKCSEHWLREVFAEHYAGILSIRILREWIYIHRNQRVFKLLFSSLLILF